MSDLPPNEAPTRRRGPKVVIVAVIVVLVGIAAASAAAAFFVLRGSGEELLSKVPGDADVVAVAYLDPSAGQKVNLLRMASKFPDLGDEQQLTQKLQDWLDQAMQDSGMTHDDLHWVGVEVAVAVDVRRDEDPSVAVLVDSNDDDAAKAALQKLAASGDATTHTVQTDGVEITVSDGSSGGAYALFDGTVVIGSDQQAIENVIKTAKGDVPGIQENQSFKDATAGLPEGRLGLAFVNVQQLTGTYGDVLDAAFAGAGTSGVDAIEGVGMTLSAEPDGMAMDLFTAYDQTRLTPEQQAAMSAPDHPNPLVGLVPADAYGMYSLQHLDVTAQELVDQLSTQQPDATQQLDDLGITGTGGLISQLSGDVAFEVSPGQSVPVGGALMVGTNDPSATAATITDLLQQLPLGGSRLVTMHGPGDSVKVVDVPAKWATQEYRGVTITYLKSSSEFPFAWAIVGDAAVLSSSPSDVEKIVDLSMDGGGIDQDPAFTTATAAVPSSDGFMFVDVEGALAAIRDQLSPADQADFDEQVGKNMAPVKAVVMGSSGDATSTHARLFVEIP